jgi:hypothetical protein
MAKFVRLNVTDSDPAAPASRGPREIWVNMDRVVQIVPQRGSSGSKAALHMSEGEPKILLVMETPEQIVEAYSAPV